MHRSCADKSASTVAATRSTAGLQMHMKPCIRRTHCLSWTPSHMTSARNTAGRHTAVPQGSSAQRTMVPPPPPTAAASAVSSSPSTCSAAHQQQASRPTGQVSTAQHECTTLPPPKAMNIPASTGDEPDQPTPAPPAHLGCEHVAPSPATSPTTAGDQVLQGPSAPPASAAAEAAPTAQQAPAAAATPPSLHAVLFNAPNSVCWLRLLPMLVGIQQAARGQATTAFWLFVVSMALDAVDGWLARHLGQATTFGALLDVVLDIWLRGWLWVNALPASVALIPPLLEMMVFTVTHKMSGADWKSSCFASAPPWVSAVMAGGGFKSPAGLLAIAGLMGCPLWLWAMRHLPGPTLLTSPAWGLVLVPGRVLAAAVEVWVVRRYLLQLLRQDAANAAATSAQESA